MSSVIDFESFTDVHSNYDPSKNKSRNIMTIYEKTNVIGLRLEQLAFGAPPLLNESELEMSLFSDLEDLDRKEIEQNANDLERQVRTIEDEHKSLR